MIRYSHVSLLIPCTTPTEAEAISSHLGIQPARIRESKIKTANHNSGIQEKISYTWMLDSPITAEEGDPTSRLQALATIIQPIAEKLATLDKKFTPWVDVLYHLTPQHPPRITGEFDWFRLPSELMKLFGLWNLGISYETMWFDQPVLSTATKQSWWRKLRTHF